MNFITLVIICLVGLFGYYLFLILKSDPKVDYDTTSEDTVCNNYFFEKPIKVTLDMVNCKVSNITKEDSTEDTSASQTTQHNNKYDTTTNQHNNAQFDINNYLTATVIKEADKTFFGLQI